MKIETTMVPVSDGTKMQLHVSLPEDGGKAPGLLLFQEMFGVNQHIKDLVALFAKEGFVTVAPELYHRTAEPGFGGGYDDASKAEANKHREAVTLDMLRSDIKATHAFLSGHERVDSSRIVSIGYCYGGKVSFLAAETVKLKAAVSYYGGGINKELLGEASDIDAPLLLVWGGKDANIPREARTETLEALEKAGKHFINIEFSEAGHGFACDERASYHEESTKLAQTLTLSFLREHLS